MSRASEDLIRNAAGGQTILVKKNLKDGADPNFMNGESTALNNAVFGGYDKIATILLEAGADVNKKDEKGFTPLQLAASKGHVKLVKLLLERGADITATTDLGGTALHVAAAYGFSPICKILLEKGADINAKDKYDCTPLSVAIGLVHKSVVDLLLKSGADIEIANVNGQPPLLRALDQMREHRIADWSIGTQNSQGNQRTYQVKNGAFTFNDGGADKDIAVKDQRMLASKDWGPKEHLKYLDLFDIVALLLKNNAGTAKPDNRLQGPLHKACLLGEPKLIRQFLSSAATTPDDNGAGLLHLVASSGRADALQLLLEKGFAKEVNATDRFGWTPLHYLADNGGTTAMAEMLLSHGADKTIKSTEERGPFKAGMTAHEIALHYNDTNFEVLKP